MSEGKILYTEQDGVYIIHLMGKVRYTISHGLDKLIDQISKDRNAKSIVVDLTEADYLDSTNFGLLAKVANLSILKLCQKPLLVSCKKEINSLLNNMGFEQAFDLTETWNIEPEALTDITEKALPANAKLLLEAHRNLCEMNPQNATTFRDVMELLQEESE